MAHERCVETVSAVSDQFNRRFCTSLGEAHRVVCSWTWALWGPRECSGSSRLPPTTLVPPLPHLGGMGSPRGMLDPTPWCPSTAQKRLNCCFWGHHVGEEGGVPRRPAGSPDTIVPDFCGHLGACSQYGTYDFLETSSICPSHVFRRAYKGSRQTNVWLQNNSS